MLTKKEITLRATLDDHEMIDHASPHDPQPPARPSWHTRFATAFRGLKLGVRGHSSFFVHFFFAALVIAAAAVLPCSLVEWCILLGCIAFVLTAELFHSALVTLFHGLDAETKERTLPALDIAAGAVLMASLMAILIGGLVFASRLWTIWSGETP